MGIKFGYTVVVCNVSSVSCNEGKNSFWIHDSISNQHVQKVYIFGLNFFYQHLGLFSVSYITHNFQLLEEPAAAELYSFCPSSSCVHAAQTDQLLKLQLSC